MRSRVSPVDPIFIPWHATVDLLGYLWELCHDGEDAEYETELMAEDLDRRCLYTSDTKELFGNFSFDHEWYMNRSSSSIGGGSNWTGEIRDDPLIGRFFSMSNDFHLWRLQYRNNLDMGDGSNRTLRHGYTYNTDALPLLQSMLKSNPDACPAGLRHFVPVNDTIHKHNQGRTVPTYSDADLVVFQQDWMERAIAHWNATLEGNNIAIENKKLHAECVLKNMDHDTLERWAIDDAFVSEIVRNNRSIFSKSCKYLLNSSEDSDLSSMDGGGASTSSPISLPSLVPSTLPSLVPAFANLDESTSGNESAPVSIFVSHHLLIASIVCFWVFRLA